MPHCNGESLVMKTCRRCAEDKPLSEFYVHAQMADGFLNICKSCVITRVSAHREANIDAIREYDRRRGKSSERLALAAAVQKKWRAEDRRRLKCHNAVRRAISSGRLVRQKCEKCSALNTHAHHEDYDKPLQVLWLCPICHKHAHKIINLGLPQT